jgi:predicted aldo/keto reductase-like oxidoreductase
MKYTKLGNTDLSVSTIGIGTEHLGRCSQKVIDSVISYSIEKGFNYFDVLTGLENQREKFGKAFKGYRDRVLIAGHFHYRTRDSLEAKSLFDNFLNHLATDYVDVLFIQWVDKEKDYQTILDNGLVELAHRYKESGKTRYIGISGHKADVAIQAARSGLFDVIMHPINLATSSISKPFRRGFAQGDRKIELLNACKQNGVGLIAIKSFWGGKLLQPNQPYTSTPIQCIHYSLSQLGVSMVLAGVEKVEEIEALLEYFSVSDGEKDFSATLIAQCAEANLVTECVFCNHCLPCPQNIDIALIAKYHNEAKFYFSENLKMRYREILPNASDCIECGDCVDRCPFNIDMIEIMRETVLLFEELESYRSTQF